MTTSNATQSVQKTQSASAGSSAGYRAQPGTRPPSYVNVPTSVAYAPVPDALVVTMARILGLCWSNDYRCTPALTPDRLAGLLDRPRTTLHRHLDILEHELGWLRRERRDRRIVLHPLPPPCSSVPAELPGDRRQQSCGAGQSPAPRSRCAAATEPAGNLPLPHTEDAMVAEPPQPDTGHNGLPGGSADAELLRALAGVGIESPARERIALDLAIEPDWIPAWQLWTQHPARANLSNPAGYIVRRLLSRSRPPEAYLQLARLTPAQMRQLRRSYWLSPDQLDLEPALQEARTLYIELFEDQIRG